MDSNQDKKMISSKRVRFLILFLTIVLIVLMFPEGESLESEVSVGTIWIEEDLIASTTFEILKSPEEYNKERTTALINVKPIFEKFTEVNNSVLDSIKNYNSFLLTEIDKSLKTNDQLEVPTLKISNNLFEKFSNIKSRENLIINSTHPKLENILSTSVRIARRILKTGILNIAKDQIDQDSISLRDGKFEIEIGKEEFWDIESAYDQCEFLAVNYYNEEIINEALSEYTKLFLIPNIIYSEDLTSVSKRTAEENVSRNIGFVNENERIIAKHDRITEETKRKIDSYKIAKGEGSGQLSKAAQVLGKFLHIVIIFVPFVIYIFLFRKNIFNSSLHILLISIVLLLISFMTFLLNQLEVNAPVELLILIPVASMLLTIIYDSRIGFYSTVIIALICGALRGNDYVFTLMNFVVGGLAAYTVRDIKNRNQIFRSFLFILGGYIVGIIAFGLERFDTFENMLITSSFAASNALISPALTFGLIIFFEKIFKITTDLTLLELTDFNSPILKELANKTPGTFTHSMTLGTMVESAAESIGANSILARVGAYYHDIGKTLNPNGFVENQLANENIHEKLSPDESRNLIIEHVNNGIKLAETHNLPKEIIDFIPMHHGTMVVSYFYEKAKEIYGDENVNIDDFRYPGPKPNTKETAILMLADACESAARSVVDSDPKKIENLINSIFSARVNDFQLDDAPITFSDLTKIKEAFMVILAGQHHKRIRYPEQDKIENEGEVTS